MRRRLIVLGVVFVLFAGWIVVLLCLQKHHPRPRWDSSAIVLNDGKVMLPVVSEISTDYKLAEDTAFSPILFAKLNAWFRIKRTCHSNAPISHYRSPSSKA
jgi:hypothetical protein